MAKRTVEQLAQWAQSRPEAPAAPANPAADAPTAVTAAADKAFPRDVVHRPRQYAVPHTLVEAELRLRECETSLADIDRQLAERDPTTPGHGEWRRRAEIARRGYEYEASRMKTCIRVFRDAQSAERAVIAAITAERDEARESCRRLASEIERLSSLLDAMRTAARTADTNAAFVEVAQLVLSEVTFTRIMERAKDKARGREVKS